jgi:hypothetical protein
MKESYFPKMTKITSVSFYVILIFTVFYGYVGAEDIPSFHDLIWETALKTGNRKISTIAYTGRDIILSARADHVRTGTPVVFRIVSEDADCIHEITSEIKNGKAEAVWRIKCHKAHGSISKSEVIRYTFTCEANGTVSVTSPAVILNFISRLTVLNGYNSKDSYQLRTEDGSYKKKIHICDFNDRNASEMILEFDGLKPGHTYFLDYFLEENVSPVTVFENYSFEEIMKD